MKFSYKGYFLGGLMVVYAFNFVDRWALSLTLQDIKLALTLTDTQLGLLTGIASTFFYAIMGVPIARWADRGNRPMIIGIMTALQSVMVALTGAVGSFLQLLVVRVFVAVGEAGCVPTAHSLIADYFSRAERARAMAWYTMGSPLSALIGLFLAGWLNQFFGWRTTFVLLGLPGVVVAVIAWLTFREPRLSKFREESTPVTGQSALSAAMTSTSRSMSAPAPSLKEVAKTLAANGTFRHLLFAQAVMFFFYFGIWKWVPTFFVRSHGLHTGELGTWLAIIHSVFGLIGIYIGGELASRYAARNERLQLQAMAIAMVGFAITMPLAYLAPNPHWALAIMALVNIPHAAISAPLYAVIQSVVPASMRAMAVALIFFFSNLIGAGLGPLLTGSLSDALTPSFGAESLRYALIALCPGYLWVGWHVWGGSRTVVQDLAAIPDEERPLVVAKGGLAATAR